MSHKLWDDIDALMDIHDTHIMMDTNIYEDESQDGHVFVLVPGQCLKSGSQDRLAVVEALQELVAVLSSGWKPDITTDVPQEMEAPKASTDLN